MYEVAAEQAWELFGDFLDGSPEATFCAVAAGPLGAQARCALESTAEALGYGKDAFVLVRLHAGDAALDPQALFLLLEGIDPLCLVTADRESSEAFARAYRCTLGFDGQQRVFGRPCVAFESFESMLGSEADKQKAWALLKKLPRFGEVR